MYTKLKQLTELYLSPNEFKPGDLVEWKPGLKNGRFPEYGEAVVVVEVSPVRTSREDAGSQYYNAPADLRCGHIDSDEDRFLVFAYDPNCMQHYVAK